jgi:hypothetical protein
MDHKHRPRIVTWLIDGNNLKCSRGVPNDRDTIIQELRRIASPKTTTTTTTTNHDDDDDPIILLSNVVLVFDGDHDETYSQHFSDDAMFQYVITDGGGDEPKDRADNYMIDMALPRDLKALEGNVHLVTADKELGKRARATRIMKGGSVVPPSKFWKQYLPNLQTKQNKQNTKKS